MAPGNPDSGPAGQRWNALNYGRHGAFVPRLGAAVLELLDAKPGERILDLGCGDGVLTARIAEITTVVGVDASPEQVTAALRRGLDARIVAGEALPFDSEFDAVFSNAALHWMQQPDMVLEGVARSLKPGGRFAAEMGGAGNIAAISEALLRVLGDYGIDGQALWPWYFPTVADYRGRLLQAGFKVWTMMLIPRATELPGSMSAWIETFCRRFLDALPAAKRPAFLEDVEARLATNLRDTSGRWWADYVRLRFLAVKE